MSVTNPQDGPPYTEHSLSRLCGVGRTDWLDTISKEGNKKKLSLEDSEMK